MHTTSTAADLRLRYATRLTAFVTARLGRDHYRQATEVTQRVWSEVHSSPHPPRADDPHAFNWLAERARKAIARHHISARTHRPQPAGRTAPAPMLATTRLGVAA
ncbi:hypothetical protein [Streptomyces spirodelae]|uniref:RNA polymerase sigma-70 region 2 domain-containing protein n=1 Tax=Streptomyces spirodelae TaxID=2812904 RepID=A0ABS3X1H8_9ACTN|nr:hypothetical protein [Streptomyces spirodelae]MBO8189211.1 hypothetical protein [Streptomyces spirodelae]